MSNDQRHTRKQYWGNIERQLPNTIVPPGPGQESVWDYPRPPLVQPVVVRLYVSYAGVALAQTSQGLRVLETSSPPVYYFPPNDVRTEFLDPMIHTTLCEWKGAATYWNVNIRGRRQEAVGWTYEEPDEGFEQLKSYFAFYAGIVDACYVGSERVVPQASDYYGGWVTSNIVGPFKGIPGSERW
jgi:uncharacterized protein (DUF427 family)